MLYRLTMASEWLNQASALPSLRSKLTCQPELTALLPLVQVSLSAPVFPSAQVLQLAPVFPSAQVSVYLLAPAL